MESIAWLYNFLVGIAEHGPLGVRAFFLGLLLSWSAALLLRWWHPKSLELDGRMAVIRLVQLVVGVAVTWGFWRTAWGLCIGIVNGTFAPIVWDLLLALADWKFPRIARALRGVPVQPEDLPVKPLPQIGQQQPEEKSC